MLRKEQIKYALHYAEDPVEWVFELVRGLEKRIDELLKFGTKVTVFQEHWHPAYEDEPEPYETVVVYCETSSGITSAKEAYVNKNHCWSEPNVQWWCYPPKEE